MVDGKGFTEAEILKKEMPTEVKTTAELQEIRKQQESEGLVEPAERVDTASVITEEGIVHEPIPEVDLSTITEYQDIANLAESMALEAARKDVKTTAKESIAAAKKSAKVAVEEHPTYQAIKQIRAEGGLNRQLLVDALKLDEAVIDAINKRHPRVISKSGLLVPDEFAVDSGIFADAGTMVDALLEAPPVKQKLVEVEKDLIREEEEALYGGEDLILNELVIDNEIRILSELLEKKGKKPAKGIKKTIREETGQTNKVEDIISLDEGKALNIKIRAEAKAAREAFKAGREEAALAHKLKQKENIAKKKIREAQKKIVKKMVKDLKKVDPSELSIEASQNVTNLLDGLNLKNLSSKKKIKSLTGTREYLKNNPLNEIPESVLAEVAKLENRNISDLSFDELTQLHDAVTHQVAISKKINEIKVGRKKVAKKEAISIAVSEMRPAKQVVDDVNKTLVSKNTDPIKYIKDLVGVRQDHYNLVTETLAGPDSLMHQLFHEDIYTGTVVKQVKFDEYSNLFKQAVDGAGVKNLFDELHREYKTGSDLGTISGDQLIALKMHSLNPQNKKAILNGGVGFKHTNFPNRVYRIKDEVELNKILSLLPEEMEVLVPALSDLYTKMGDDVQPVFYEMTGHLLETLDNYYPLERMPLERGQKKTEKGREILEEQYIRVGLSKGQFKERVDSDAAIYLNGLSYDLTKSAERTSAYIGLEKPLTNASNLLFDNGFRKAFLESYDKEIYKIIETELRNIAGEYKGVALEERAFLLAKNAVTTAMLGARIKVALKQTLSLPIYATYVKPRYLAQAMAEWVGNSTEIAAQHTKYSPDWVKRQSSGFNQDINDVYKTKTDTRLTGEGTTLAEKGMIPIQWMDKQAVGPGMHATVLQAMAEFKSGKFSSEFKLGTGLTEAELKSAPVADRLYHAYRFADYVTQRTQPQFGTLFRSAWTKDSMVGKSTSMFGAATSAFRNLLNRTWRDARRTNTPEAWARYGRAVATVLVINTIGVLTIDELTDLIKGKDTSKKTILGRVTKAVAGLDFVARMIVPSAVSRMENGAFMQYDTSIPILRVPQLMADVLGGVLDVVANQDTDNIDKLASDVVELSLMRYGIPYQGPKEIVETVGDLTGILPKDNNRRKRGSRSRTR